MLRQGLFVADFAYLQNEAIPSFIPPRPSSSGSAGFDYDVLNAEVLLTRAVGQQRPLDAARRHELPLSRAAAPTRRHPFARDAEEGQRVGRSRRDGDRSQDARRFGGQDARRRAGRRGARRRPGAGHRVPQSFARGEFRLDPSPRRRDGDLLHQQPKPRSTRPRTSCSASPASSPNSGTRSPASIRDLPDCRDENGRTVVPLQFAPRQSWFVVFAKQATGGERAGYGRELPAISNRCMEMAGPWEVSFDPKWFYPDNGTGGKVRFDQLEDWTHAARRRHPLLLRHRDLSDDLRIPAHGSRIASVYLDLGVVKNVARVRLNGRDLGVVWTAPWRVEITGALKSGANELEIEVANLWPNRLIGDATLPQGKAVDRDERAHLRHDGQRHLRLPEVRAAQEDRQARRTAPLRPARSGDTAGGQDSVKCDPRSRNLQVWQLRMK